MELNILLDNMHALEAAYYTALHYDPDEYDDYTVELSMRLDATCARIARDYGPEELFPV